MAGRRTAYTERGIGRVPCQRCGRPSVHQWQACALDRRYVAVCSQCDAAINALVLDFFRVRDRGKIMRQYRRGLGLCANGRSET